MNTRKHTKFARWLIQLLFPVRESSTLPGEWERHLEWEHNKKKEKRK